MLKKLIAIAVLIAIFLVSGTSLYRRKMEKKFTEVLINKNRIWVEVADNPLERRDGLANTESLGKNQGMLFIFEFPQRAVFWMKDMHFPLDIIWINPANTIIKIHENIPPCDETKEEGCARYTTEKKIDKVLEVPAGWVNKHNVKIGDKVEIR